jgi:hypothetical protein
VNRDDIIRMAREADLCPWVVKVPEAEAQKLERFANLVAAAEREAWANDTTLKLIADWKYMVGIAERGFGTPLPERMAGTEYLLSYVKELEARANLVAAAERDANLQQIEIIVEAAVAAEREACAEAGAVFGELVAHVIRARGDK